MRRRTKLAAGAGAALAVAGAGGAVAANQTSPSDESKAVVEDAAKQLGVDPAKLGDALKQALGNRIDEAVDDGALTMEQGEAMKQRIQSDEFPLLGRPFVGGLHKFHRQGRPSLDAAATYLGLSKPELRDALREGTTLAQVAEDEGKPVDGLVDAIVAATTNQLDDAVTAGKLTQTQRDEIVGGLEARTTDAVNGVRPSFERKRSFGFRGGPAFGGPPRDVPPGA